MTIRSRLMAFIVALLLPAFCAAALAVLYVYKEERAVQEQALAASAQSFASLVRQELRTYEATLASLALSPALLNDDLPSAYGYAKALAPAGSAIVLSEAAGAQIFNTRVPLGGAVPATRSPTMQALMDRLGGGQTLITDLYKARTVNSLDVALQMPVLRDGHVDRYISMGLSAARLQALMDAQHFPAIWLVTLVDRNGVVIARSDGADKFLGTAIRPYSQRIIAAAQKGRYPSVTLDGVDVTAFFNRVPQADWTVLLSVSNEELSRIPRRASLMLAASMLCLLALGALIATRMARSAILNVQQLNTLATAMQQGTVLAYQPGGIRELDGVGQAMSEAMLVIDNANARLREEVAAAIVETERIQQAALHGQQLEALGRLSASVTHEFNNLLQTMMAVTELMHRTNDIGKLRSLTTKCRQVVERGVSLTRQLKTFGRVSETEAEVISLCEHIPTAVDLLHELLPASITLRLETAAHCPLVRVDPLQLELAILNIAINARDAMTQGGTIMVRAGETNALLSDLPPDLAPGSYVMLSIQDDGTGMDRATLARALEPFFTTKAVGTGTGLGLAQAYGFSRQSGGTTTIESTLGVGTVVTMYFPVAASPLPLVPG